ncbi:MAG: sugar phosphate isomerase/epimerase [Flavobacteriales bacterium]|jgi:sugar phosphate isomerase/epimerase
MKIFKIIILGLLCVSGLINAKEAPSDMQYSVQLWSVRDAVEKDFKGTLKALAEMGFDAVEFAGNYGGMEDDPMALKAFLDSIGLKASAAHVRFHEYNEVDAQKWINFFKVLDCKYLINPMDDRATNAETVEGFVKELNTLSKQLMPHGLYVGYHNHTKEFDSYKDSTFWDYIGNNTTQDVVLQLDVGWVKVAGKSPINYIKKFPGSTITTHYKAKLPQDAPASAKPFIGEDTINWPSLITATRKHGGTLWYTLEQEDYPDGISSLNAVKRSFTGLKAIIAKM